MRARAQDSLRGDRTVSPSFRLPPGMVFDEPAGLEDQLIPQSAMPPVMVL